MEPLHSAKLERRSALKISPSRRQWCIPWSEPLVLLLVGTPIGNLAAAAEFESSDGHVALSQAGELEKTRKSRGSLVEATLSGSSTGLDPSRT